MFTLISPWLLNASLVIVTDLGTSPDIERLPSVTSLLEAPEVPQGLKLPYPITHEMHEFAYS